MLIQELERITGLDRATIRYYEKEGLLTPIRAENGYRSYSDADAENLIRIKLLRQLGVPLGKIAALQKGTENFVAVIDAQIKALTSQIDRDERAKAVCIAIMKDGVDYLSLDAVYYLKLFDHPAQSGSTPSQEFREQIPEQIHPWRRFAARSLDYFLVSTAVQFLLFVILRIRPVPGAQSFISILLVTVCSAVFVPIEALLLHLSGTTPGKLAMGIRIERIEGGFFIVYRSFRPCKKGLYFWCWTSYTFYQRNNYA